MSIEKSLDATQFVHRLLVSACLTLLVFVISAEPVRSPYVDAQAQYAAIGTAQKAANEYMQRELARRGQEAAIRDVFEQVFPGHAAQARIRVDNLWGAVPSSSGGATLDSLFSYYETRAWTAEEVPILHLKDLAPLRSATQKLAGAQPDVEQIKLIEILPNWRVLRNGARTARVQVTLEAGGRKLKPFLADGDAFAVQQVGTVNMDSVSRIYEKAGLIAEAVDGGNSTTLASLLPIWHELDDMTTRDASSYLRMQAEKARGASATEVTLLGFKIRPRLLTLAGPPLVLFFMVYLLSHLLHLYTIRKGNEAELRCYPWMGVYTNQLGAVIIYGSVTVLPLMAVALTVHLSSETSAFHPAAAALSLLGVAAVGALITRNLSRLNTHVRAAIPPEEEVQPAPSNRIWFSLARN